MEIAGDGRYGGKHDKKLIRAVFFSNFLDIHSVALTSEFRVFFVLRVNLPNTQEFWMRMRYAQWRRTEKMKSLATCIVI